MGSIRVLGNVLTDRARDRLLSKHVFSDDGAILFLTLPIPVTEADLYGVKLIASCTTGTQHIPMGECAKRGIRVVSLAGDQSIQDVTPTAEHTFGLIWAITRQADLAKQEVEEGRWDRSGFAADKMLSQMTLGIVGYGRIGKMVGRIAQGYGMRVTWVDRGAVYDPELVIHESDIVSLHLPLTSETRGTINGNCLALMKRGAYLINTARGEIVDDDAIVAALRTGHLAGYAADVLSGEFEPDFSPAEHPLVKAMNEGENIYLTPHIGGSTLDAWEKTQLRIIEKMEMCLGQ